MRLILLHTPNCHFCGTLVSRQPVSHLGRWALRTISESEIGVKTMTNNVPTTSMLRRVAQSFLSALGSFVFGLEDGTVSIVGLVFGVAASASNSQIVVLAGATGAVSAAVSMMAGTYLDVSTERDRARAAIATEQREIEQEPERQAQEMHDRLLQAGFARADVNTILTIIRRTPGAMLKTTTALELQIAGAADRNPWTQAIWMFVANLFAAFVPVLPFVFLPLRSARIVSLMVTTLLLVLLGVLRGVVGHKNVLVTALQTLAIATAAGMAGLVVGWLVAGRIGS